MVFLNLGKSWFSMKLPSTPGSCVVSLRPNARCSWKPRTVITHLETRDDLLGDIDEMRHVAHRCTEPGCDTIVERVAEDRVHPILRLELRGEARCKL